MSKFKASKNVENFIKREKKTMKLKEYIDSHGVKYPFVAAKIGVSIAQLYRMFEGKSDPKASVMQAIEEYTNHRTRLINGWIELVEPLKINYNKANTKKEKLSLLYLFQAN